jgi:dephospho-CoA kinase
MISIGITGIIGSGKSMVSKIFEILNCPVYYADIEAKKLMINNNEIKVNLINVFGADTYVNGIPNKELLSKLVFGNSQNREKVNSIVHPVVLEDFKNWLKHKTYTGNKMAAIESALLYQAKIDIITDYNIEVICSEQTAIKRIMLRDKISKSEATNKIRIQKNQIPRNVKPDFIIENNDSDSILLQCIEIMSKINHQE